MINRFWDINKEYTKGFLKDYEYWALEVSYRQHTLGSFIIFLKNEKKEKISELNIKELGELKMVMGEIEKALFTNKIFKPDRFNYWQMGNKVHYLHVHGFPRYAKPRIFNGEEWIDKTWGNPPVWRKESINEDLVVKVKDAVSLYL